MKGSRGAAETLEAISTAVGNGRKPLALRSDNGGKFRAAIVSEYLGRSAISQMFIRPGYPEENVIVERLQSNEAA